jgi:hypothetical protein
MTIRSPSWRVRVLVLALIVLGLAVALAAGRPSTASAGFPCNTHATSAGCSNIGTMLIVCWGANLRYAHTTSSAIHGNPTPGTYFRYSGYTSGQFVDGSGYCLGISSLNWLLTDSGWITRTLAYIS